MKNFIRFLSASVRIRTLLVSVCFINAAEGQNTWTVLSVPDNPNEYTTSSFINDEEGWMLDNTTVLWHTTDGCATLDTIFTDKAFLKLDFVDPLIGYALDAAEAYKTTDGGFSWTTLVLPGSIINSLYFLNKDTGFISGSYSIYRTTDGGASWITISPGYYGINFYDYFFLNDSVGIAVSGDYNYDYYYGTM
ncbi:MAG: hypothetical protein ABIQ74_10890 [Chitinophagales bacterium]